MLDTRVMQENQYAGEPSDEVDNAWAELTYRKSVSGCALSEN